MQQSSAGDVKLVALLLVGRDAQGDVGLQLLEQPFAQLPAGDVNSILAGERRIVDAEDHLQRRLVHLDRRQGDGLVEVGDGVADVHVLQADHGADVAGADLVRLDAPEAIEDVELGDGVVDAPAVRLEMGDALALLDLAGEHPADGDAANVIAVVQRDDQHLQGGVQIDVRRRHVLQNGVEQRPEVGALDVGIGRGDAVAAGGVNGREVQRGIVSVQLDEQIEDAVEHVDGPGVGAIDLVDDDDGPQTAGERLAQHEARLRHDALGGIDQQQSAVGHVEDALDLAAEVGVAGRVDDVDLGVAHLQGDVLGQDGDAALAFEVVGIEDAVCRAARCRGTCRTDGASDRPAWFCRDRRGR